MVAMQMKASSTTPANSPERRSFIVRFAAAVTGTLVALFPFAAGWGVITNPLRRSRGPTGSVDPDSARYVRVCPLDALPADGLPREFAVVADVSDAWTHAASQRIGAVFLTRSSKDPNEVTAFTATCPHLGCAVEFDPTKKEYECPCHKSGFAIDGQQLFGPSRRGLDSLPVKLADRSGAKEVLVEFERFKGGIAEKEPIE
jgi:nitrite reductase/ring-hydroxylating ferredoxin subunit